MAAFSQAEADALVASIPGIAAVHGVHEPGPTFTYVAINERGEQALGRPKESLIGVDVVDVFGPGAQEQLAAILERAVDTDGPVPFTTALPTTDGIVVLDAVLTPYFDDDGRVVQMLWAAVDSTGERAAQQALARSEARFRSLVDNAFDGVGVVDAEGHYTWVSPSLERLLGLPAGSMVGRHLLELVHPDDVAHTIRQFSDAKQGADEKDTWVGRARHGSGEWRWLEGHGTDLRHDPNVGGIVLNIRDITDQHRAEEALRASEQQYRHLALHDELTGLPNRALFADRADHALAALDRHDGWLAILFCDLDGFKWLNDSYGHALGDEVVVEMGRRLSGVVRETDTVARFSGDEFLVLCPDLPSPAEALATAERLLDAVREPVVLEGIDLHLTVSVGVALTDRRGVTGADLIAQADAAMYEAKRTGRDRLAVFDTSLLERARDRIEMGARLRRALGDDELVLHYQPLVEVATGRTCGVEALVRWKHPERGLLLPSGFIPVIEESGLMGLLDEWVLDTACREARTVAGFQVGASAPVSVNLSATRLADPGLPQHLASILDIHDLPASHLVVEVTESAVMDDVRRAATILGQLRELGVRVGIDDFGTGHAALSYLRDLPLDFLKVDRRFVNVLGASDRDAAIVHAIVDMAHALDLVVVAEGVETETHYAEVAALGCDIVQGWYTGRPTAAVHRATAVTTAS